MTFLLLAVSVLVAVLILVVILVAVLVLILIVILGTVAVLVVHNMLPSSLIFAAVRYSSLSCFSGFILCFKEKAGKKSRKNRNCDASCRCL